MPQTGEINLIPHDVFMRDQARRRMGMWAGIILLLMIALLIGCTLEKRRIGAVESVIADLSLKKNEIEEKMKQMNILQSKRDRLARKERVINTLLHKRSLSLFFARLEQVINNNLWLTSFSFKDDFSLIKSSLQDEDSDAWVETGYFIVKKNAVGAQREEKKKPPAVVALMQGRANSNKDLADFLRQLSSSEIISDVNLKYSREGTIGEMSVVEFEIEAELKKNPKI